MFKYVALLAILFCAVGAEYNSVKTADNEFLLKQKKIYNLLYHISQPSTVNPGLYSEGQSYNIEANIDSYAEGAEVKDFLYMYQHGFLPRGEVFSVYYPKLLDQSYALFKLFYYAKDFDTFYKTALWARAYINEGQFCYALYNAVLFRPDTKYIQLPPPYEMYPYAFFNSEVLEKAHHAKLFGKLAGGFETYIIPANYSGWYLTREYDLEHKLNYLTEDIGWNAYYFFFRMQYPFWLEGDKYNLPKYRGEEYLYGHKQILTRYFLERYANDIPKVEFFDWNKEFYPGYYPSLTYHNGLPFPQRPHYSTFPYYKFIYMKEIQDMENRISSAIDVGYVVDSNGKFINIYTPEGLNILGNLIEGNKDSCNKNFYGSIDNFGRKILGFNLDPSTPYQIAPSALESFMTSMRDPAIYRLYKKIYYYYYKYKLHEKPYTKDEIIYPDIKIESFAVDKLTTYFDYFDASISNGLAVDSEKEAENFLVKIRQYRLNHKPFNFHISVNSEKATKATIRMFIGPKFDIHRKLLDFSDSFKYFYEIDNFIVDLNVGSNKIERSSHDCFFVTPDPEPSELFYKKIEKALDGSDTLNYNERVFGFPERLLLPKGKKEGMPFQIFLYISPVDEVVQYSSRVFGEYKFDKKPFGFPLDRPAGKYYFDGPNMLFKDILIYHKDETDINVTY
ncbi:hexamerin-like isoform X2 [Prorops nasuta]|uniref:hexamerin-like isoform X2 n=1 Tax=Prorops nasuta TaxID=863751 RepID=UPI0034CE43EB